MGALILAQSRRFGHRLEGSRIPAKLVGDSGLSYTAQSRYESALGITSSDYVIREAEAEGRVVTTLQGGGVYSANKARPACRTLSYIYRATPRRIHGHRFSTLRFWLLPTPPLVHRVSVLTLDLRPWSLVQVVQCRPVGAGRGTWCMSRGTWGTRHVRVSWPRVCAAHVSGHGRWGWVARASACCREGVALTSLRSALSRAHARVRGCHCLQYLHRTYLTVDASLENRGPARSM